MGRGERGTRLDARAGANKTEPLSRWLTPATMTRYYDDMFTNGVVQRFGEYFDQLHLLPLDAATGETFACSLLSAPLTCASLRRKPIEPVNVRAHDYNRAEPNDSLDLRARACAAQGGCLGLDLRAWILQRTVRSAMDLSLLPWYRPPPRLCVNQSELGLRLDALGLCFCAAPLLRAS